MARVGCINLAGCYFDAGRPNAADDFVDELARIGHPAAYETALTLANRYLKSGQPARAAELAEQALLSDDPAVRLDARQMLEEAAVPSGD